MKNIILIGIAAVLIVVAIIITFPLIPDDFQDPMDPDNPELDATFKQEMIIEYTDGTTESISSGTTTLEAYRDSKPIYKFVHKLYGKLDDGADTITIRSDDVDSINNLYDGSDLIRGPSVAGGGIIPETTIQKGEGWIELCSVRVHPNSLIYDVSPGSYTATFEYSISNFEYYINSAWKSLNTPPEITFTVDIN